MNTMDITNFLNSQEDTIATKNNTNQNIFFNKLQSARIANNISAELAAERLGITVAEINQIENGQYELTLTELRLIAIAYEIVVDYQVTV
jgi:transcriptional regulator with XRE-family HTH domain